MEERPGRKGVLRYRAGYWGREAVLDPDSGEVDDCVHQGLENTLIYDPIQLDLNTVDCEAHISFRIYCSLSTKS